jgi:hypothetical protein
MGFSLADTAFSVTEKRHKNQALRKKRGGFVTGGDRQVKMGVDAAQKKPIKQ